MNLSTEIYKQDISFFLNLNEEKPTDPPPRYISEYIETRRIMPTNTPFPGTVDISRTEYAREIMNCFSPYDPTQYIDVMSASQIVKTFILECVCGYFMGALPSPILFMSGTEELLNKWWDKRLEPMIDSLDLREKMISPVENEKSRRTGDTSKRKLFNGGFLEKASAQSASSQRADSVRILLLDELDAAPSLLTTGEGYWDENAEARTKGWGNRRKVGAFSTSTDFYDSAIFRRFQLGDQCEYLVPCPMCGKMQFLERGSERGSHGLRAETKNGEVEFIYYLCDFCHDAIFENHKPDMIKNGKWQPMAKPERLRRSFHLNALIAPYGGFSWLDYWSSYSKAQRTPDGMRVFINHQDGLPYKEVGMRPKLQSVISNNRGKYNAGEVQEGILYLTGFIDVQRGSKNDPDNPARLEMEILGIGSGYRTASVIYKVFEGGIKDPYGGAWEDLHQWALETELLFIRKKDGFKFPVSLILIDSGDGENSEQVYRFSQRWANTFPSKGFQSIQRRKKEKPDELSESSFKRYRAVKLNEETTLFEISTNYYKNQIYNNLNIVRQEHGEQKPGFCDFPHNYSEYYFEMLIAEERLTNGTFDSHGRRNEALDARVGCLAAADIFLDSELLNYRAWAKQNKARQDEIMKITHRTIIDRMEKQTAIKPKKIT